MYAPWPTFHRSHIPTHPCVHARTHTHTLTLLFPVISVFCPSSIAPSHSNTPSFPRRCPHPSLTQHTHSEDKLTLGNRTVVVYRGKYVGAKGGFGVNRHTWLSKQGLSGSIGWLANQTAGCQAEGRGDRWTLGQGGAATPSPMFCIKIKLYCWSMLN